MVFLSVYDKRYRFRIGSHGPCHTARKIFRATLRIFVHNLFAYCYFSLYMAPHIHSNLLRIFRLLPPNDGLLFHPPLSSSSHSSCSPLSSSSHSSSSPLSSSPLSSSPLSSSPLSSSLFSSSPLNNLI
jgi:hypothetical protein